MHPALKQSAADFRIGQLRRTGPAAARPSGGARSSRRPWLRAALGFAVVEAGLRLALYEAKGRPTDAVRAEGRPA